MANSTIEELTEKRNPKGAGRKADPEKRKHFKSVGMVQADWDYLELWLEPDEEDRTPTDLMREAIARLRLMFPAGPNAFGHVSTKPRKKRLPFEAIKRYADQAGITKEEAIIEAWRTFEESRKRDTPAAGTEASRKENE